MMKCKWPGCEYEATEIVEHSIVCSEHYYAYYEEDRLGDLKVIDGGADGTDETESELATTVGVVFSVDGPQEALDLYVALEDLATSKGARLDSLNVFANNQRPQSAGAFF